VDDTQASTDHPDSTATPPAPVFSPRALRLLDTVSLVYVGLPIALFLAGWLQWALSIILLAVFAGAVYASRWRETAADGALEAPAPSNGVFSGWRDKRVWVVLAGAFVVAFAAGIGGYTIQWFEYFAFDAMFLDLMQHSWPLGASYGETLGDGVEFRYYFGYFLPVGLVGKAVGWTLAYHFSFLWAVLGIFLAAMWFMRLVGSTNPMYGLLFLLFGGLDILGYILTAPTPAASGGTWGEYFAGIYPWHLDHPASIGMGYYDWWLFGFAQVSPTGVAALDGNFFFFSSTLTHLSVSPHHVLPAWLIILLIFHDGMVRNTTRRAPFLWALLPFCSALVAIGAAPFVAYMVLRRPLRESITFANAVAGPALIVVAGLFLGSVAVEGMVMGPLWSFVDVMEALPYLLLFYLAEFGIFFILCGKLRTAGRQPADDGWWYIALAAMLIAPWYVMGDFNDLTTKGLVASQLVLVICIAASIRATRGMAALPVLATRWALIGLVTLGTLGSVGVLLRAAEFGVEFSPPSKAQTRQMAEVLERREIRIGEREGWVNDTWRMISRKVAPRELPPIAVIHEWDFTQGNPLEKGWTFLGDRVTATDDGVLIERMDEGLFMRWRGEPFDCSTIGDVVLDLEVETAEGWQPDFAVFFRWGDAEQTGSEDLVTSYPRWHFVGMHPYFEYLSANSYWRGTASDLAFDIRVREDDEQQIGALRIRVRGVVFHDR